MVEQLRWDISQLMFKILQNDVCGTAVSMFWRYWGVPSDAEKVVWQKNAETTYLKTLKLSPGSPETSYLTRKMSLSEDQNLTYISVFEIAYHSFAKKIDAKVGVSRPRAMHKSSPKNSKTTMKSHENEVF